MKQQERLQKESEAVVVRREAIVQRRVSLVHGFRKQMTKGDVNLVIKHMQRKVKDAHKVAPLRMLLLNAADRIQTSA